ncbi:hypothetical protein [Chitinophaga rhizosphaerae]
MGRYQNFRSGKIITAPATQLTHFLHPPAKREGFLWLAGG